MTVRRLWRGHPVSSVAHPERPWWRLHVKQELQGGFLPTETKGWLRSDGAFAYGADAEERMAEHDALHPLPAPEPLCGQVWQNEHGTELLVTKVWRGERFLRVWFDGEEWDDDWPPEGMHLVAGSFSPWSNTGDSE